MNTCTRNLGVPRGAQHGPDSRGANLTPCLLRMRALLLGAALHHAAVGAAVGQTITVLPDYYFTRLSGDGSMAVGSLRDDFDFTHAIRWSQAGGLEDLGIVPDAFSPIEISRSGEVWVGTASGRPARWVSGEGVQDLGAFFPDSPHWNLGAACDVSNDGRVIVGYAYFDEGAGDSAAFRWSENGGIQNLDFDTHSSQAYAVSRNGATVAGCDVSENEPGRPVVFRWTVQTGFQRTGGFLADCTFEQPTAISDDGRVIVGAASCGAVGVRAFRWTPTTGIQDLGTLGGLRAIARDVSADGSSIVGESEIPGPYHRTHGFLFTSTLGMVDLNVYLPLLGFDLGGREIVRARSISDDGRVILADAGSRQLMISGLPLQPLPGDMNCDGVINSLDINPFTLALLDPAGYAAAFPDCRISNADVNGDGSTDIIDINPFLLLLRG